MASQSIEPTSTASGAPPIERCIRDVEGALGVQITLHDRAGFFHGPDGGSLLGARRPSHRPRKVCGLGFSARRCNAHCNLDVHLQAAREGEPFVTLCWKGLRELIVPILRHGVYLGALFVGTWRDADGAGAPSHPPLPRAMVRAYRRLSPFDPVRHGGLARLFRTLVQGWVHEVEERHTRPDLPDGRAATVVRFLKYRATEEVRLGDLAEELHLSESRTSHLVGELFGASFQELLKRERILRAKVLLTTSEDTVGQIARRVGMPNEYHFNRTFRKLVGLPPGRYRRQSVSRPTRTAH